MPVSISTFLYGLSILAGILFVAHGVRPESRKKDASQECCRCSLHDELTHPTPEVISLQFTPNQGFSDEPPADASQDEPLSLAIPGNVQIKYCGQPPKSFMRALKAPFHIFSRKRDPKQSLDRPVVAGIELTPKARAVMDDRERGQL
jgi:hypothetical protein